jgi:hypothetical protein
MNEAAPGTSAVNEAKPLQINPTQLRPAVPQGLQQGQQGGIPVDTALMIGEQAIQLRGMQQEMQRLSAVLKVVENDRNAARKELDETKAKYSDALLKLAAAEEDIKLLGKPPDPPEPIDSARLAYREVADRAVQAVERATGAVRLTPEMHDDAKAAKP